MIVRCLALRIQVLSYTQKVQSRNTFIQDDDQSLSDALCVSGRERGGVSKTNVPVLQSLGLGQAGHQQVKLGCTPDWQVRCELQVYHR